MHIFRHLLSAAALLLCSIPVSAQVTISEFMAVNESSPWQDEDSTRQDWVELHNAGAAAVTLNGWYLTDDAADLRKWRFPVTTPVLSLAPGGRMVVWCSGKNRKASATALHTNFKLERNGEYLALVQADGFTVASEFSPAYPVQPVDRSYGISGGASWQAVVGPGAEATSYSLNVKARVATGSAQQSETWQLPSYSDTAWTTKTVGIQSGIYKGLGFDITNTASPAQSPRLYLIHTSGNVQTSPAMQGSNASLQVRFPFTISSAAAVQALQLRIRYEDGFIAWLNGNRILDANAPVTPVYNSAAASDRENDQCEDFDIHNLPGAQAFLVDGLNVLSFQALNNTAADGLFLLTPILEARMPAAGTAGTTGYLQQATPGSENTVASTTLGPDLNQTTQNPPRPPVATSEPFLITTRVRQMLNPVSTVTLRYVRMYDQAYGSEPSVPMNDAGTGGDVTAGDGIWSAQIPGTVMQTLQQSQMIRWRIEATDSAGNATRDPSFTDPLGSDAYYGTITQTPGISTNLPLLVWISNVQATHNGHGNHTFSQAATTSRSGKYDSFYFKLPGETDGRFYDNVRCTQHGQSTGGFDKKSQNINFNSGNPFTWRAGEKEISSFNLLSNYADKSKLRNTMAWEFWNRTRHPSHWCQMVRVQQVIPATAAGGPDAQFYGIWDMVEDGNKDFLRRWGLDPEGALYKCYNSLDNATQTTNNSSGVEKKTREWEGFSDLQALVTALDPAKTLSLRRQWTYDNVDVPALINMLAVHAFIRSNDYAHKNYYIYRDTNGTGEWSLIPWDQDLSFGHTWVGTQGYFDDDIDSARGLVLGATATNRLTRLAMADSSSQELPRMFLRRMRTLMDTYLGPDTAQVPHFEGRAAAWLNLIDPDPNNFAAGTDDADRDYRKWGFWVDGSGAASLYTAATAGLHSPRAHAARITNPLGNPVPTYPGASPYAAYGSDPVHHTTLPAFLPGRRSYLYRTDASRPMLFSGSLNLGIPPAQPAAPPLVIQNITFNPGTAGQDQEYFVIRNTGSEAVDISDWKLAGEVDYQFRPGTVIPAQSTTTSDGASSAWVNQLIVAKSVKAFRTRTASPKAGEYRHLQGGYNGQLSARGGTLQLLRPDAPLDLSATTWTVAATATYPGSPTAAQTDLRITELNYNPAPPTPAESAALPGVGSSEFEFLELVNNGSAPLALGGARFERGIEFTFPAGYTLAAGARCLLVAWTPAFQLRYGNAFDSMIAGEYTGRLDNAGEEIQLVDSVGEVVLEFTWGDDWFPITDGGGRSLVTLTPATAHTAFGSSLAWSVSDTAGGTPGAADTSFGLVYETWRPVHFAEPDYPVNGAPAADPDGDGTDNLGEYAFGLNPLTPNAPPAVLLDLVETPTGHKLRLQFPRRRSALDITTSVEHSDTLAPDSWTTLPVTETSLADHGNGTDLVTAETASGVLSLRKFVRVRAIRSQP